MSKFKQTLIEAVSTDDRNSERATVQSTTKLEDIQNEDLRELLEAWYKSRSLKQIALACLVNAAFTEFKCTFLLSYDVLGQLIKTDKNIKRKTLSGSDYKKVWAYIFGNNHFEIVKQETGNLHRATVVQMAMKELVAEFDKMVGFEFRKLQKEKCVELFDSYIDKNEKLHPKLHLQTSPKDKGEGEGKDNDEEKASSKIERTSNTRGAKTPSVSEPKPELPIELAERSTRELMALAELVKIKNQGDFEFTAWEVKFIEDVHADLSKHKNGLVPKKQQKLFELLGKAQEALAAQASMDSSNKLVSVCRQNPEASDDEIQAIFAKMNGQSAYESAIDGLDLKGHRNFAAVQLKMAPPNTKAVS